MFTRMLVPLDGSERAEAVLPIAGQIASQLGCPLALLSVAERLEDRASRQSYVDRMAAESGAGEASVEWGHPVDGILAEQARVPGTLLAMSTHGRSAVGEELMGSVAQAVVARSVHPVLVYKPNRTRVAPVKRIVLSIDGTAYSTRVIDDVARLAAALGTTVDLIQVLHGPAGFVLRGVDVVEEGLARRLARQIRESHHINVGWDILHSNNPGEAIAQYVSDQEGSLVALASHSRSGVDRLLHGSVAATCIRRGGHPVLVYGPHVPAASNPAAREKTTTA